MKFIYFGIQLFIVLSICQFEISMTRADQDPEPEAPPPGAQGRNFFAKFAMNLGGSSGGAQEDESCQNEANARSEAANHQKASEDAYATGANEAKLKEEAEARAAGYADACAKARADADARAAAREAAEREARERAEAERRAREEEEARRFAEAQSHASGGFKFTGSLTHTG